MASTWRPSCSTRADLCQELVPGALAVLRLDQCHLVEGEVRERGGPACAPHALELEFHGPIERFGAERPCHRVADDALARHRAPLEPSAHPGGKLGRRDGAEDHVVRAELECAQHAREIVAPREDDGGDAARFRIGAELRQRRHTAPIVAEHDQVWPRVRNGRSRGSDVVRLYDEVPLGRNEPREAGALPAIAGEHQDRIAARRHGG